MCPLGNQVIGGPLTFLKVDQLWPAMGPFCVDKGLALLLGLDIRIGSSLQAHIPSLAQGDLVPGQVQVTALLKSKLESVGLLDVLYQCCDLFFCLSSTMHLDMYSVLKGTFGYAWFSLDRGVPSHQGGGSDAGFPHSREKNDGNIRRTVPFSISLGSNQMWFFSIFPQPNLP